MNTEKLIAQIEQELPLQKARVFTVNYAGEKYIVKGQQAKRSKFASHCLTLFTQLLGLKIFRSIYLDGDKLTQDLEVKRLTDLAQAGVPVPQIILVREKWFVMTFLGEEHLFHLLVNPQEKPAQYYWQSCLAAILAVHQKGAYLSYPAMRNIVWYQNTPAFIDFEDDPGAVLGCDLAQARDWMIYLYSSLYKVNLTPRKQAEIFWHYLQQDKSSIREMVLKVAKKISFLRHLPRKRRAYWGRDVISIGFFASCMHELIHLTSSHLKES